MRTALGEKLKGIRDRALANGMTLLSEGEVLAEVRRRRAGCFGSKETGRDRCREGTARKNPCNQ